MTGRNVMAGVLASLALASCAAPEAPRSPASPASTGTTAPTPALAGPGLVPVAARPPVDSERWTGLVVQPVTEALARSANVARAEGLYVQAVESESPAARAGIRTGDVLLLAGGSYLGAPDVLPRVLAATEPGASVEVVLRRAGELVTARLAVEPSPAGRLMLVIQPPAPGLLDLAADGVTLWAFGAVPGTADRGIVPVHLPGGSAPAVGPRAVASPVAERVIAADTERVYLGWAGSELYIDVYEIASGRVGRIPVRGAEGLANRCRPRGLTRVGSELWMACQIPQGPVIARIDLGSGQARIEPLPVTYWSGLAFDGQAVLWLCCLEAGRASLARTDVATGESKVFPLTEPVRSVAADGRAVYLLGPAVIYQHKPWR